MMELKRRDFLKGLMGLAGVAIIGLPVADTELFDEIDQFLEQGGEPAHPVGPYGSMRIDDKWYAAHDANVNVHQQWIEVGESWQPQMVRGMRNWSVDCSLKDATGVNIFDGAAHEIEINVSGHSFSGKAYITGRGASVDYRGMILFDLTFEGAGALMMDGQLA